MLKKLLLGMLIFVGVCTNMEAEAQAQWHSVESMGTTTSIDLHSVKPQGLLVEAWEQAKQAQASNGSKKVVLHNQYDLDSNKWRNIGSKFYNAQGVTLGQKKSIGQWQKMAVTSQEAAVARYCMDYSRQQGTWIKAKQLGTLAIKYFDADTLKRSGNTIDVWEKLELLQESNGTKTIVSHMQYNLKTQKVHTLYNCNYTAQGALQKAAAATDEWGAAGDTYGEYIGQELEQYLQKHKRK
jgi:hypothetical protein